MRIRRAGEDHLAREAARNLVHVPSRARPHGLKGRIRREHVPGRSIVAQAGGRAERALLGRDVEAPAIDKGAHAPVEEVAVVGGDVEAAVVGVEPGRVAEEWQGEGGQEGGDRGRAGAPPQQVAEERHHEDEPNRASEGGRGDEEPSHTRDRRGRPAPPDDEREGRDHERLEECLREQIVLDGHLQAVQEHRRCRQTAQPRRCSAPPDERVDEHRDAEAERVLDERHEHEHARLEQRPQEDGVAERPLRVRDERQRAVQVRVRVARVEERRPVGERDEHAEGDAEAEQRHEEPVPAGERRGRTRRAAERAQRLRIWRTARKKLASTIWKPSASSTPEGMTTRIVEE